MNNTWTFHARTVGVLRIIAPMVAAGVLLSAAGCGRKDSGETAASAPPPLTAVPAVTAPAGPPSDLTTAIVRVAKQNIPAVVHIEVTQRQEIANPFFGPFGNDPFFQRFFGMPNLPKKFEREQQSLGSGMIMDTSGHVLTNAHVVAGASEIQVVLADGEKIPGKVVGADPKTDLAVLKIPEKSTLPHITFGDSDRLDVGEWVVAIGHPRGLDQTVTQGIISAKHRAGINDPSSYEDFLQTDAAINPGNSGGPLLNLQGQVIGVNAMIASNSGGYEGISFAIPSNMATHVAQQLIQHGKVERGWLGVSIQNLTPELAKSLGIERVEGALISDVVKDGPADKAGIKRGDVVVALNGQSVKDATQLRNAVAATTTGSAVKVMVSRKGQRTEYTVKVGNLEAGTKRLAASVDGVLGASVRPVTAKEAQRYNLDDGLGAVIAAVDPDGPLGQQGLEAGDLILQVNNQDVRGVDGYASLVSALRAGQKAAILVLDHRTGNTGYVVVAVR